MYVLISCAWVDVLTKSKLTLVKLYVFNMLKLWMDIAVFEIIKLTTDLNSLSAILHIYTVCLCLRD